MAWTQTANIRGASGTPGASGATGPIGASGVPGASGATGATGATGASGPAGTTTWSGITDKPAVIAAGTDAAAARNVISAEYTANKGVANGYCGLDASGLVPSSSLPGFVDDVIEGANLAAFAATGVAGALYVALDTNKVYRWSGSTYVEISGSPGSTDAVPEGSTNLYYTAARADGRITAAVGSSVQAYSATLTTYAGKTAPTGAVVGTTDSQALTNKDLSGASNTFPAFIKRSVSTITSPTTLGSAANTDYVVFCSSTGDAAFANVVALLHGEGSNASMTLTDSSSLAANWTAFGDAKLSTARSKFGSASFAFDGTGDYIKASAAASNFAFAGDFTVELFLYTTTTGNIIVYDGRGGNSGNYILVEVRNRLLDLYVGTSYLIQGTTTVSTNTWHHIALCRFGTNTRLFLNGTQEGATLTNDTTSYLSTQPVVGGNVSSYDLNGNVDEIRVTRSARYIANFTAPTAAFPDSGSAGVPTLPTATGGSTNQYTVRNISNAPITIGVTSSQQIDGATGGLALPVNTVFSLISDGFNWRTV